MGSPGVLFDLYGTLVLSIRAEHAWRAWLGALRQEASRLAPHAELGDDAELRTRFWAAPPAGDDAGAGPETTPFERRIIGFLNVIDATTGPHSMREPADELCRIWQAELLVDPRARAVLEALGSRVPVGLATNFDHPPHVRRVVQEEGLEPLFGEIVISGEEGSAKPEPGILLKAAEGLGIDPQKCAYVGDSMVDYDAAVAAGMRPVIIRRHGRRTMDAEEEARLWHLRDRGEVTVIRSLDMVVPAIQDVWQ